MESLGWEYARSRAKQIKPGDYVIPYLMKYRLGPVARVVDVRVRDEEWAPTVPKGNYSLNTDEADHGRRIHVVWQTEQNPPFGKAALTILRDLPRNGPYVFCWPDGRPLTVDYTTHAFHKATTRSGIRNLRQHDLRHRFAIRRLRGGANLVAVSGLLRHATTRMSERYLHVTRADLRAAVEAGQPSPTGTPTGTDIEALLQQIDSKRME